MSLTTSCSAAPDGTEGEEVLHQAAETRLPTFDPCWTGHASSVFTEAPPTWKYRWFPGRSCKVLEGSGPRLLPPTCSDVTSRKRKLCDGGNRGNRGGTAECFWLFGGADSTRLLILSSSCQETLFSSRMNQGSVPGLGLRGHRGQGSLSDTWTLLMRSEDRCGPSALQPWT